MLVEALVLVIYWLTEMSLRRYFQPKTLLPTPEQTGIGERPTTSANTEVREQMMQADGRKRKAYTAFTDEDRAKIGKHAAKNGNNSPLKKFRSIYPDLGESTVRSFKKYYEALKEKVCQSGGQSATVEIIPSKERQPSFTRRFRQGSSTVCQSTPHSRHSSWIRSHRCWWKGIVTAKDPSLLAKNGGHIVLSILGSLLDD